jgi:D-amino-acid dehydrogenase
VTDAGRYLDGLDGMPHSTTWSGLRPCSPDGLPIVGRSPSVRNAVYATGHGMAGLTLGPITGLAVAELLTGAPASVDLGPLSPARFAG